MGWFTWRFRTAERERARTRLEAVRSEYAHCGSELIRLSGRMDLVRRSAGATLRSFEYVERAFASAGAAFSELEPAIAELERAFARGRSGDFSAAEAALKRLIASFSAVERLLSEWEARWQQVPRELEQAAQELAALTQAADQLTQELGRDLPARRPLTALAGHLERVQAQLAAGNPVEAGHLLDDFQIAHGKVADQVAAYRSAAGAIDQARAEWTALSATVPAPALATAERLLNGLTETLLDHGLERFQGELLKLQRQLAGARKAGGP